MRSTIITQDRFGWGALALGVALFLAEQVSIGGTISSDFVIFWHAARAFWAGAPLYDPGSVATLQGFLYPPPSILPLAPLGLLSVEAAARVFGAVQLVALAWSLWAWSGLVGGRRSVRAGVVALAMATGPVFALRVGQIDGLVLATALGALVLQARGRPGRAGALVAAGCWVKIYPVLLLAAMLARGDRWRVLGGFVAAAAAIPLLALAGVPASAFRLYFGTLLPGMAGGTIVNIYNQSVFAVLARVGIDHPAALTAYGVAAVPGAVRAAVYALALAGIGAIAWRARGAPVVAAWCLATIPLIAPLGWGHCYVYALPLTMLVVLRGVADARGWLAGAGLAALAALVVPAHHRFGFAETLPAAGWGLVYARYAVATLGVMALAWCFARTRTVKST